MSTPDSAFPAVGFRRFNLPWRFGDVIRHRERVWTPGGPTRATCAPRWAACGRNKAQRPGIAPQHDCCCGLYAFLEYEDAFGYSRLGPGSSVAIGAVIGWGRVFFDEDWWRAEMAQIVAFADPEDVGVLPGTHPDAVRAIQVRRVGDVAETYNVPVLGLDDLTSYAAEFGEILRRGEV